MSAQNPSLCYVEIRKLTTAQWSATSEEERQKYRDRYSALKNQYHIDMAAYNSRGQALIAAAYGIPETPDAIDEILERELGPKPKIPISSFSIYCRSATKEIREEDPGILWNEAKNIADLRWKNLSKEDRQPFRDRYDALKKQYKIDKATHEARKMAFLSACHRSVSMGRIGEGPTAVDDVLERELGPKPKRPLGAHHLYRNSISKDIRKENPGANSQEVTKLAGIRWKYLSKEERRSFKDRSDALNRQYKIDKAEYDVRKESFLSAYRKSVSTVRLVEPEHSALSTLPGPSPQPTEQLGEGGGPTAVDDVLERELGPKPKRPLGAHHLYRRSAFRGIREDTPGLNWQEAQRLADLRWKKLSEEDRQPFKDRCRALSNQYRIDKAAYDARKEAFLKGANSNLREPCDNSVANTSSTARSSQPPAPSMSPGPLPRPIERRNEPEHTTASASSGYTGLFSSQPPPLSI
ncbi:hypothetical protein GGI13_004023, partial [Coemansia sp. RSA 455]